MEQLQGATTEEFIALQCTGKCGRCSNYYWDGSVSKCHEGINESNCEKGYAEWLESYPGEDLQRKYNKQYWCVKNHTHAYFMREIMDHLYFSGILISPLETETRCGHCHGRKSCAGTECFMYYQHLLNEYKVHNEKLSEEKHAEISLTQYISDALVPQIADAETRGRIKQILELLATGKLY